MAKRLINPQLVGAQKERDAIRARVKRDMRNYADRVQTINPVQVMRELLIYIDGRSKRFKTRKGGL